MSPSRHSVRADDFLLAVFAFADPHHAETVSHTDWIQQSPKPMDVRVSVLSSYTDALLTASPGKGNSLVRHLGECYIGRGTHRFGNILGRCFLVMING